MHRSPPSLPREMVQIERQQKRPDSLELELMVNPGEPDPFKDETWDIRGSEWRVGEELNEKDPSGQSPALSHYSHGFRMGDIEEDDEDLATTASSRSEIWSQLGQDDWLLRCREDGQRQLLDIKALPFARSSHGAPFVRAKIVEALESVGKLREGTCNLYGNGLYDGGLHNIKPSGWGVCSWPDGEKYEGEWHDGAPNGLGSSVFPSGDRYHGEWRNGMRDGYGRLDCENFQFRGGFDAGSFSRYGRLNTGMNGECRYDGWFREGKKWGWGHAQFQSVRYNGYFSRDMPHGTLTESLLIDGRWYECEAKYQQGKLVWRTPLPVAASSNAGDFLAVQIQRKKLFFGIESQRNFNVVFQGDRRWYIGETEDGEIEGLGIESVEREDGTCELYAGQFCQGVRRGHGIVLRGVGDFYVGDFDDGLPHGAGFDLSHDRYYAGEMQCGQPHGFGDMSTNDGTNCVGTFQGGELHGRVSHRQRDWGRWTRFDKRDGLSKFVWERSGSIKTVLSTMLSSKDNTQPTSRVPPEGLLVHVRDGRELPFAPTRDDRFSSSAIKFYDDLVQKAVVTAKDKAKKACVLVMQLEKEHTLLVDASQALQTQLEGFLLDHPNVNYYYYTAGVDTDRHGPVAFDSLVQLFKTDVVHLETYIWHKLLGDKWIKLKDNGAMLDALRISAITRPSSGITAAVKRPFSRVLPRPISHRSNASVKPPPDGWFYYNSAEDSLIAHVHSRPQTPSAPRAPPGHSQQESWNGTKDDDVGIVEEREFEAGVNASHAGTHGAAHVCIWGVMRHIEDGLQEYNGINGEYLRSDRRCNGRAVYLKIGKPSTAIWWANVDGKVSWCVGPADSVGQTNMWAYVESMGRGPEEAGSRPWHVYSYHKSIWEEQNGIEVLNLDRVLMQSEIVPVSGFQKSASSVQFCKQLADQILDDAVPAQVEEGAKGPMAFDRIIEMYRRKVVTLDTYVWHTQYGDNWLKLKDTGPLLGVFQAGTSNSSTPLLSARSSRQDEAQAEIASGKKSPFPARGKELGADEAQNIAKLLGMLVEECVENPLFPPVPKGSNTSSYTCNIA